MNTVADDKAIELDRIGAVIALIIGGAGASIPEVTLLIAIFKKRLVVLFVTTVFAVATAAGFVANALLA